MEMLLKVKFASEQEIASCLAMTFEKSSLLRHGCLL